ncbi:MAG: class I SAM-dependent methyltransferase [Shewanella sp.]|nr:class I SAM-dependent methyltransferase [Shewanella sp.]MCF1431707.1 class I SAM-dependent methyltransferase [Shewanella sp.]MCF1459195.1 class I SAM-dependent methyltransferase [Shewanella sp.]
MKLNHLEKSIISHPLRLWVQTRIEAPVLLSMFPAGPGNIDWALEIGCGFGQGVEFIRRHLGGRRITAVDLDEEQVAFVRRKYDDDPTVEVLTADATGLPFADNQFDMVCNFAVFHHIVDWQLAITEVFRVLRPGGHFLLEDLYKLAICNPVSRRLFEHPQENRFNHEQLLIGLQSAGFELIKARCLLDLTGVILVQKPIRD